MCMCRKTLRTRCYGASVRCSCLAWKTLCRTTFLRKQHTRGVIPCITHAIDVECAASHRNRGLRPSTCQRPLLWYQYLVNAGMNTQAVSEILSARIGFNQLRERVSCMHGATSSSGVFMECSLYLGHRMRIPRSPALVPLKERITSWGCSCLPKRCHGSAWFALVHSRRSLYQFAKGVFHSSSVRVF